MPRDPSGRWELLQDSNPGGDRDCVQVRRDGNDHMAPG